MTTSSSSIVQQVWNYCNVLSDDGMCYGDYVEQPNYLLFLKVDAEQVTRYRHLLRPGGQGQRPVLRP